MEKQDLSDNPYLKIDNPYEDVQKQQAEAQTKVNEIERLCYSVFHQYEDGKRLWEFLHDTYLMRQHIDVNCGNAQNVAIWWDGFKAALLSLYNTGLTHIKKTNGVI